MFKFEYLKETIAVFLSNAISDHEMSFEINITSSMISDSNWENLKHIELQPNGELLIVTIKCLDKSCSELHFGSNGI